MKAVQNIIVEREANNRVIWLHKNFIIERTGMSDAALRVKSCQDLNCWRSKLIEGNRYFDYDTIPNRAPKFYRDQFSLDELVGIKPKEVATQILSEKLKSKVLETLDHPLVSIYISKGVEASEALQLAEAKAWLDLLLVLTKAGQHILFGFDKIGHVFDTAAKVLGEKKLKGLKTSNPQSLRNKLNEYAATPAENRAQSLLHGLVNNQNAAIIGKEKIYHPETGEEMYFDVHLAVIYSLWLNVGAGNKQFKKTIHKEYAHEMATLGMEPVSYQTLCKRTNQFSFKSKMAMERSGSKYFNDNYLPYVSAERLQLSNTMWVGDGSSTKLLFNNGGTLNALMCYRVFDTASHKLLGWHIYKGGDGQRGEREEVLLKALEMAYKNAGVAACEFTTDNGGAHSKDSFKTKMKLLFKKYTQITPGNSQANPAELFIKSMNNFGRSEFNWNGSWVAKADENLNDIKQVDIDKLPNKEQAYFQYLKLIENWNAEIRADKLSHNDRYEINKNQKAQPCSEQVYRFVFGKKTQRDLSYSRGFVDITSDYTRLQYTIPNYEQTVDLLTQKTGGKGSLFVNIFFDEKGCDVYNLDNEFICHCLPTAKAHKSEYEAFEGSDHNLHALWQRKEKFIESANQLTGRVQESMEAVRYEQFAKQRGVVKDDWEEYNINRLNQQLGLTDTDTDKPQEESEVELTEPTRNNPTPEQRAYNDIFH